MERSRFLKTALASTAALSAAPWAPYTYARSWKLGQKMSYEKINAFISQMKQHVIGIFAYFNVTGHGGAGGAEGSPDSAAHLLHTQLADALVKDVLLAGRELRPEPSPIPQKHC